MQRFVVLAGAQVYQRGLEYFSHGHIESLEDTDGRIRVIVRGNRDYTVTLAADDGVLAVFLRLSRWRR